MKKVSHFAGRVSRSCVVAILGLGYVGFPLAAELCKTPGFRVMGIDINPEAVRRARFKLMKRKNFTASSYFGGLKEADIVVICVPTPIFKNEKPNYRPLEKACREIRRYRKPDALVIIESTVNPGTCEEIILPILQKNSRKKTAVPLLAHCPERIDPGNSQWTLTTIPRVVGGLNAESTKRAAWFYRQFVKAPVKEVSSLKVAEASKIVENTFRDVNIAYVNELAKSFDRLGIDVVEVIEAAKTKPFAFLPHYPGAGVGGHCIGVDPYYLIDRAQKSGFSHDFLKMARRVNRSMPAYTVSLLENFIGGNLRGKKVGLLGLAYKKDVGDLRESPALEIFKLLIKKNARVVIFDPYVSILPSDIRPKKHSHLITLTKNVHDFFMNCKGGSVILATDHSLFQKIPPKLFQKYGIRAVIDGRNILPKEKFLALGVSYKGIGR